MVLSSATSIWFPNLGIELKNIGSSINIFGFPIAYYGIIIACGMAAGYLMAEWMAKCTKQNTDIYLDFALYAIIFSVIGARLYYVAFAWDEYKNDLIQILNTRKGGLAIYGGVIAAVMTAYTYCKIKKYNFGLLADTGCIGLITGQIIGRWGNFFNREAFGKYSDGPFAMLLNINDVSSEYTISLPNLTEKYRGREKALNNILELRNHIVQIGSENYISVHPTFLYECIWNICVLILLIIYTKHKKFNGEVFLLYLAGYGLGRLWIEGLRTDQLFLWNSPIAVSQMLSGILFVLSVGIIAYKRSKLKNVKRKG